MLVKARNDGVDGLHSFGACVVFVDQAMTESRKVSVLIPTLQANRRLPALVAALNNQTLRPFEVIVVDSESDDGTAEVARSLGCIVHTVRRDEFDHGGTRNMAARIASGDIILFMTDDAVPANRFFIENLTKRLGVAEIVAAYARQLAHPDARPTEVAWRMKNYPERSEVRDLSSTRSKGLAAYRFSDVASAVVKSAFDAVGGFPARLVTNEDMLLCAVLLQRGFKVAYEAEALVMHSHNLSLAGLARRYFDMGVFLRIHGELMKPASAASEGMMVVKGQVFSLLDSGRPSDIPRCIVEALVRFCAYGVGKHHSLLPKSIIRYFSANKGYWLTAARPKAVAPPIGHDPGPAL